MYDINSAAKNAARTSSAIGGLKSYFNNFNSAKTGGQKITALFQLGKLIQGE